MLRKLLLIILLLTPLFSYAQRAKEVSVSGNFVYHFPLNISPEQAKIEAIKRAQKDLIANEFGTSIHQHTTTSIVNKNGESTVNLDSNTDSDVLGEWLQTVGDPKFSMSFERDMLVVKLEISGKIRAITNDHVEYAVHILRNGTDLKYESHQFRSGDDLYVRFKAQTDGYLAIYLDDNNGNVLYLSPYRNHNDVVSIEKRKDYIFYSSDSDMYGADSNNLYVMTCSSSIIEYNTVHVLFSPNHFMLAEAENVDGFMVTDHMTFHRWLAKMLAGDRHLNHKEIDITIEPKY